MNTDVAVIGSGSITISIDNGVSSATLAPIHLGGPTSVGITGGAPGPQGPQGIKGDNGVADIPAIIDGGNF